MPPSLAAKAGRVPAAPSTKLRPATTARRCVFLDKVLPFSTTGHHSRLLSSGRDRPSTPNSDTNAPATDSTGVGRILPNGADGLSEDSQGGVEGGARAHGGGRQRRVGEVVAAEI